ncbi:ABC transporter permease [bacterium]|nr:ABC transporter permease [bacterium]
MLKRFFPALLLPLLLLVLWETAAVGAGNPALIPRIESVASILAHPGGDLLRTGTYLHHIAVSGLRVIIGFMLAAAAGIPLGLLAGRKLLFSRMLTPLVELLRPLCPIAWIPFALAIFRTWAVTDIFGLRYSSSIFAQVQLGMLFVIFYGGFFPIFLNTVDGVRSVKNIHLEAGMLLGADQRQLFRKVIFPSALPQILTGLRVGLGICWMVIIAAEMMPGSDAGLGYLIMFSYELAEMDILIACMILIGLVGTLLSFGLKKIADRTSFWQAKEA